MCIRRRSIRLDVSTFRWIEVECMGVSTSNSIRRSWKPIHGTSSKGQIILSRKLTNTGIKKRQFLANLRMRFPEYVPLELWNFAYKVSVHTSLELIFLHHPKKLSTQYVISEQIPIEENNTLPCCKTGFPPAWVDITYQ